MSREGSEQMLSLLKELAVFKAMDQDYRAGPKGRVETEARAKAAGDKAGNATARCREQGRSVLDIRSTMRLPTHLH
jgi:hypothetical protein